MSKSHNRKHSDRQAKRAYDYRHLARQLSLQAIHQLTVQDGENLDQIDSFLQEFGAGEKERKLAHSWILGTWQHLKAIDQLIENNCNNWDIKRLNLVDHSNLRLAVYQLLYCPDVPPKVVLNEAIELAKIFSSAQAPGFINGMLDVIFRSLDK